MRESDDANGENLVGVKRSPKVAKVRQSRQCEILISFLILPLSLNDFHKIIKFSRVRVRASSFLRLVTVCFLIFCGSSAEKKIPGYF